MAEVPLSTRLQTLARRRKQLLERSAQERQALADIFQMWERPARWVDAAVRVAVYLRGKRPLLLAGIALSLLRPGAAGKWMTGGAVLWRVVRVLARVRSMLRA